MSTGTEILNAEMAMDDNDFYTTVGWGFSIAENLYLIDPSLVPVEWEYRPSILGVALESYSDQMIREFVLSGEVTANDLIEVGNAVLAEADKLRPEGE